MDTPLDQTTVEKIHSYETSIVELYDDEAERTLAREAAAEAEEISIDEWNKAVGAAGDPTDTGEEPGDGDGDEGTKETRTETGTEDGTKTGEEADPDKDKAKGDEGGEQEPTEAEKALAKERDEALERANELQRKEELRTAQSGIDEKVNENLKGRIAEVEQQDAADAAKLKEFETNYGPEAAAEMRSTMEDSKKARHAALDQAREAETAKLTTETEQVIEARDQNQRDVEATPELKAWQADAIAFHKGDTSKSSAAWDLAVTLDGALKISDAWKGKPQTERFEEVVKMVKASGSAPSSGSPPAQKDKTAQTDEELAKKAAAEAAAKNAATGLATLTDITGGDAAETAAKLENIGAAELRDLVDSGKLSQEQMEKVAAQLLED